jgi:hypothetical protein
MSQLELEKVLANLFGEHEKEKVNNFKTMKINTE